MEYWLSPGVNVTGYPVTLLPHYLHLMFYLRLMKIEHIKGDTHYPITFNKGDSQYPIIFSTEKDRVNPGRE